MDFDFFRRPFGGSNGNSDEVNEDGDRAAGSGPPRREASRTNGVRHDDGAAGSGHDAPADTAVLERDADTAALDDRVLPVDDDPDDDSYEAGAVAFDDGDGGADALDAATPAAPVAAGGRPQRDRFRVVEGPPLPITLEETGIDHDTLMKLLAKWMHTIGTTTPSRLVREIKLSKPVVTVLLESMTKLSLIESRGLNGSDMTAEVRYALTQAGTTLALDSFEQSQYLGPAPVSLEAFCAQIRKQSVLAEHLDYADVRHAFRNLVLPEYLIRRLGPAANSGKTILLYGEPGNGKTSIAEALGGSFRQNVYLPYAIEIDGHYIKFFDAAIHHRIEPEGGKPANGRKPQVDMRWVLCKRPTVMTGGELTLDMLDLQFNPHSKFYEAPLHLKAIGGIFIVDDFGRQQDTPQAILNRWIVPLERKHDYLTMHTGRKFTIPFDELVIFSTNIAPLNLVDAAGLRRLYYKIMIPMPSRDDYMQIFRNYAASKGLSVDEEVLETFYRKYYEETGLPAAGHQPKFMIDHLLASCEFSASEPQITLELLDDAWHDLHVE